jgi:hypothetical protein
VNDNHYDLTYLSLGAGVQSSAMLVMTVLGLHDCPRADFAIFADTQGEPQWVYDQVSALTAWAGGHNFPIHTVTRGSLSEESINGRVLVGGERGLGRLFVPAFLKNPDNSQGIIGRQCTEEYKIKPINHKLREFLGVAPRARCTQRVRALIGISTDEADRMKTNRTPWIDNCYPLIDAGLNRDRCVRLLHDENIPTPPKSACVYCPYHGDRFWLDLKKKYPEEWARAVGFDDAIRKIVYPPPNPGLRSVPYLHRQLKPLAEVEFDHEDQMDLFSEECAGICGAGICGV